LSEDADSTAEPAQSIELTKTAADTLKPCQITSNARQKKSDAKAAWRLHPNAGETNAKSSNASEPKA